jgi:gliding motility-associated-like protein
MTKRFYLVTAVFIFLLRFVGYSQISSSVQSGCAPLLGVTFTYSPAGVNPVWDFGDGSSSASPNPVHTFSTPKTYTVTYTANGVSTQSLVINVYGKPTPSFSAISATKGCVPYPVTFKDNSTGGGGVPINTWQWAFGDGGTNINNSANQTYTYGVGGQFNVTVKIIDQHGCDSSLTIPNMVTVSQKPTISVTPFNLSACLPPLAINYTCTATSHSPINNNLNYLWTFNTGATSTLANPPTQTYTTTGVFPVQVKVTDANNCSDSVLKNVIIQNPTAVFTVNDTVCAHDSTHFHPHGSSAGIQTWNYGDGQTGTDSTHYYSAQGHYTATLTVTNGACSNSVSHSIYAEQPSPNFSLTPSYICSLPKVVSLTNTSAPPNSGFTYSWSYTFTPAPSPPYASNISTVSSQVSPTFTVTHIDTNRYTINKLDTNRILLTLTTIHGCVERISHIDSIFLPAARFMPDKYEGCVPLKVTFSDSSKFDSPNVPNPKNPITSWEYIFGDGTSATVNSAPGNIVHTYTAVGIYYPILVIHTLKGCGDTSYAIKIEVGSKPVASFSVSPPSVCIGGNVTLTNTTPTSYSVDTWHYLGDGGYYASSCSDAQNLTWPFTHATGPQNVSLVTCFRGCCDTVTQTGAVDVKGPLAKFTVAMNCDSSHVFNFAGNISTIDAGTSWTWNFGDGDTTALLTPPSSQNIAHTYTATGDYNVILSSYAPNGCHPSKDTITIHVRDLKADFKFDTLLCATTPHNFDASISTDVYTGIANNGYIWLWGDGTHPDILSGSSITHNFSNSGRDTVRLIVKDINGCTDTVKKIIRAFAVVASFTCNPIMCTNSTVTFTNTSTADTTISASTGYSWSFGDGNTSTQQNPVHTYSISNTSINTVTVTLVATSALGCVSTHTAIISISRPNAIFHPTSSINICSGSAVSFASTNSYPNMTWNFGDGTTLGPTPPSTTSSHSYTASGNYTISLSIVDAAGCIDVKTYNQPVNVQNIPQVIITSPAFASAQLCRPYQAQFTDNSVVNIFASRVWNLGNGSTINNNLNSVGTIYSLNGTYTISLTETTTNGCAATLTKTITVVGPQGDFTLTPSTICKGQSITFTIKDTSNVAAWNWDFGDGVIDSTSVSPISHTYNFHPPSGSTNVQLVLYSPGLTCNSTASHPINIQQVIANFNRNLHNELFVTDTAHCVGSADTFTNTSTGADTYGWNYGDGSAVNTTTLSPQHQYTVAGVYNVELFIKNNASGCVDTLIKKMYIYPAFSVTATGDTICQGSIAQLNSSAATTYSWSPAASLSSATSANPTTSPNATSTFSLMASDINGCKDSVTAVVYVIQPPVTITWSTSIVVGQTVVLPGNQVNAGYTYTWSPIDNLSCIHCPEPVFSGTVDAHYTETIADVRGCFTGQSTFYVEVKPLASIDVPTAFTPNGDGTNDIVYVDGWGIKILQYFKIFNRWGELVFESNDLKVGWDGVYKGVPQNMETYVYEASAIPYISDKPITKKGYIKLLR